MGNIAGSPRPPRGGIYARLSQSSDDAMKLTDQVEMSRRLAAAHGIDVVRVYDQDDGISAFTGKDRPGWNQMLRDIQDGELDVVLAQSEDRFARQVMDKEALSVLCTAHGVTWLTVNDGATDPSKADGEFFSVLRVGLARMESRRKSERQAQRNAEMRARGELPRGGRRPFGYERVLTPTADGRTVLVDQLHPTEAPLVSWAYEHCLAAEGTGLSAIRTHFNKLGVTSVNGNPFDLPKVEKILRRARNAGLVEHKLPGQTWPQLVRNADDELIRGVWPKIVEEDVYLAVVAKLDDPNRRLRAPRPSRHLLSSIVTCVCGVKLRVAGRTNDISVYRCGCHDGAAHKTPGLRHVSIRCLDLDEFVARQVVHAMMVAPGSALPNPAGDALETLHVALTKNRWSQQKAAQAMLDPELEHLSAVFRTEVAQLRSEERRLERAIDELRRTNAQADLVHELSTSVRTADGRLSLDLTADLHAHLMTRFRALKLDDRRALVRAYVDVQVVHGRPRVYLGADGTRRHDVANRVNITHKIATILNVPGSPG